MKLLETTSERPLFASATHEELVVSQILLELEDLFPPSRFIWGFRKMRSCLDAAPSDPPSVQIAEGDIEVRRSLVEAGEEDASTATATVPTTPSPATRLSFLPRVSDGKFKRSSKMISKKKSRAEFNIEIEELSKLGVTFQTNCYQNLRCLPSTMASCCGPHVHSCILDNQKVLLPPDF